jgi:hypothetical protein
MSASPYRCRKNGIPEPAYAVPKSHHTVRARMRIVMLLFAKSAFRHIGVATTALLSHPMGNANMSVLRLVLPGKLLEPPGAVPVASKTA